MATVTGLFFYPVKSCRGIVRSSVQVRATGFEWDRHWMIVDAKGTFQTQRTHPQLARIIPEIATDALQLSAPGMPVLRVPLQPVGTEFPVRVWDDRCMALDQGAEAADWVSRAVGQPVHLVRVAPSMARVASAKYAGSTPAPMAFADGYPVLVCNQASLADLNSRLPEPIPMERFRPNIVVEGLPPFAEDRIAALRMGDVTLRLVKPCARCVIPSIDQQTGEPSTNPTPALRKFRFDRTLLGVTFGENAVVEKGAGTSIECGTQIEVIFE
ncbi:MAG: MOSC N-terminal beta barrel domain-containing protein [Sinobacteraceae bacterium]|nr:MOSC N-terminal beta barrel domain-containing protein [Nevskiaceae bacterium]